MTKNLFKILINLFILLIFKPEQSFSQKSASIWIFGQGAGLNFEKGTGAPSSFLNSNINTTEGCATLSDENGNLHFYTDGVTVWNKNHQVMRNGTRLRGAQSSTQAAIIVPHPGNPYQFYIFTTEDHLTGSNSLSYSIVDMSQESGLGSVLATTKNTFLTSPCAEKLTAIQHQNGKDFWILSHKLNSNQFVTYLLTSSGVSSTPVTSSLGRFHSNMLGYLKASHQGTKIALAVTFDHPGVETFDFNKSTGIVSNVREFNMNGAYGIEFSPNDKYLYVSTTWGANSIYQIDLNTQLSKTITTNFGGNYVFGALQLAPNGIIYIARNETNFLDAITSPNEEGMNAGYRTSYLKLSTGSICKLGLPNFVQASFIPQLDFTGKYECATNTFTFTPQMGSPLFQSFTWNFGDPGSGTLNTSTSIFATHTFSDFGTFTVTLSATFNGSPVIVSKTIINLPPPTINLGQDITLCTGESTTLNPTVEAGTTLRWSNGTSGNSLVVTQSGTYWVEATRGNCTVRDEIQVGYRSPPSIELGSDTTLCFGESIIIGKSIPGVNYVWQDGSTGSTYTISKPGTYKVTASLQNCSVTDSINVYFQECEEIFIPNIITPNNDGLNDVFLVKGLQLSNSNKWELSIFNRWGTQVYHTSVYNNDWNADNLSTGTYYYSLTNKLQNKSYKGWLEIVR